MVLPVLPDPSQGTQQPLQKAERATGRAAMDTGLCGVATTAAEAPRSVQCQCFHHNDSKESPFSYRAWCVWRCGLWEVGFTQYDPSVNMQNNYPSLAYAFVLHNLVRLLKHQQDIDTSLATVDLPLLMTQNECILALRRKGELPMSQAGSGEPGDRGRIGLRDQLRPAQTPAWMQMAPARS